MAQWTRRRKPTAQATRSRRRRSGWTPRRPTQPTAQAATADTASADTASADAQPTSERRVVSRLAPADTDEAADATLQEPIGDQLPETAVEATVEAVEAGKAGNGTVNVDVAQADRS